MPDALNLTVQAPDLRGLYQALKDIEGNLRVELRRGIKAAAQPVADRVKSNARWSSRIPGAVKIKTSFGAKQAGVTVYVDSKIAPEGAPLENKGSPGRFRHPVFADAAGRVSGNWTWVSQQAHPFFGSAPTGAEAQVSAAIMAIVATVERKAGFN